MDLEKEIKALTERGTDNPIPLSKMALITAATFDQFAVNHVSQLFWDKKFRELANFDNIEKLEQDRIFNELVLAGITLVMLTLESPDLKIPNELKEYYLLVKDQMPKAHLEYLKNIGIEKKYLTDWEKLIEMRYKEYSENKHEAREAFLIYESKGKELTNSDIAEIQLLLPVQTVAVGCHHHICRQKTKGKDELFKLVHKKLCRTYLEIRVPLIGGKITRLGRIRVGLRHLINRRLKKT